MQGLESVIQLRDYGSYQRENFDKFLNAINFKYKTPSIHVAGTNGKGSTSNFIASIYKEAGYKVGLFTSPSMVDFNHDIMINFEPISDEKITEIINQFKDKFIKYELSYFEVETFIALTYFDLSNCDIAIVECGMGGLIDATNIFAPELAIITSISLEHTSYLGRSLYEITLNKLGICREECRLLIGSLQEESMDVIKDYIVENRIKLFTVSDTYSPKLTDSGILFDYLTHKNIELSSFALFSVKDACLAIDAIEILNEKFPVSEQAILTGLRNVKNKLRFEIVSDKPTVILDGAHNPEAMEALSNSLWHFVKGRPIHTIFACYKDKNLLGLLSTVGVFSSTLTLTTYNHPRARTMEDYFLFGNEYPFEEDAIKAINETIEKYPEDIILVTGSIGFVSYIYRAYQKGELNVS